MDAAAKTVEWLSKHILPEKPHHLSYSPQWRFRPRPEDHGSSSVRFEEWYNTRLQYMTLVSQADRGIMMTRPYYDMREDPPKPVPRQVSALAKSGDKKKKLSLSDYKNKRTGLASSDSPPEPTLAKQREADRAASPPPRPPPHASAQLLATQPPPPPPPSQPPSSSNAPAPTSSASDARKPAPETKRPEGSRLGDTRPSSVDAKPRQSRDGPNDAKLPPKPPSLPAKPLSPPAKRRAAEADDARPPKRPRPDEKRPTESSSLSRDDGSRRKDRPQSTSRDAPANNEDGFSSSLPNGKSALKSVVSSTKNTTPSVASQRRESVNGLRPTAKDAARNEKADSVKPSLPPLLSPLHFSFGGNDKSRHGNGDTSPRPDNKKKKPDAGHGNTSPSSKRSSLESGRKRSALALTIPRMLSPTLPPVVEDEMRRRKRVSVEKTQEKVRENGKKKPAVENDEAPPPPPRLGHRRRLIISLFIPEHLRSSFRKIVAPASSKEEAHGKEMPQGKDTSQGKGIPHGKEMPHAKEKEAPPGPEAADGERKKERPASDEAPLARKRPAGAMEGAGETTAVKRSRTSDMSMSSLGRVAVTPSTPSKKSTAMSRVSSTNSLAATPGDHVTSTPAAGDRRPNGQDSLAALKAERPEVREMVELHERLTNKAKSLKRNADAMLRDFRNSHAGNAAKGKAVEHKVKLGYVLSMESIIAFIMAFQTDDKARSSSNRLWDHWKWHSMFPLIELLVQEVGRDAHLWQPLYALLLMLHARCHDELLKCYGQYDYKSLKQHDVAPIDYVLSRMRRRGRLWASARDAVAAIDNPELRAGMTAWASLDDVTDAALRVLRRWCVEEKVDWTPQPMIRDCWPICKP